MRLCPSVCSCCSSETVRLLCLHRTLQFTCICSGNKHGQKCHCSSLLYPYSAPRWVSSLSFLGVLEKRSRGMSILFLWISASPKGIYIFCALLFSLTTSWTLTPLANRVSGFVLTAAEHSTVRLHHII